MYENRLAITKHLQFRIPILSNAFGNTVRFETFTPTLVDRYEITFSCLFTTVFNITSIVHVISILFSNNVMRINNSCCMEGRTLLISLVLLAMEAFWREHSGNINSEFIKSPPIQMCLSYYTLSISTYQFDFMLAINPTLNRKSAFKKLWIEGYLVTPTKFITHHFKTLNVNLLRDKTLSSE